LRGIVKIKIVWGRGAGLVKLLMFSDIGLSRILGMHLPTKNLGTLILTT